MRQCPFPWPTVVTATALTAFLLLVRAEPASAQQSVTARLEPMAGSGASGTATLTAQDGGSRVSFDIVGLAPGASYPAQLHAGTCAQLSASFTSLGTLVADPTGRASASSPVLFRGTEPVPLATLVDGDRVIVVMGSQSVVACGAIPRLAAARVAQVPAGLPATGEVDAGHRPGIGLAALGLALLFVGLLLRRRGAARGVPAR
ncbi:MAG: hypothetical protein M3O34_07620 [Chloroflexota bacterium]|nr:hypothetical protein [Chloroflexota bacterium]